MKNKFRIIAMEYYTAIRTTLYNGTDKSPNIQVSKNSINAIDYSDNV